jgi:ribonuclease HI
MGKGGFYAVRRGRKPGIFLSWKEVEPLIVGFKGSQHKKFNTRAEAEGYIKGGTVVPVIPHLSNGIVDRAPAFSAVRPVAAVTAFARQLSSSNSGIKPSTAPPTLLIYTDGACKGNNNVYSKVAPAGWGLVVVDEATPGAKNTELCGPVVLDRNSKFYMGATVGSNNTAELSAIGEALHYLKGPEGSKRIGHVKICYDSEYAARSVRGEWNGDKNVELILHIRNVLREVKSQKGREVFWEKVKGHSGNKYNDVADALANRGAHASQGDGGRYNENTSRLDNESDEDDYVVCLGPPKKKPKVIVDLTL